jgi:glycosyltransferase involved in cell wall biosynthesis
MGAVTVAGGAPPRVLMLGNVTANRVAAGLSAALAMLCDAERVRLAELGETADIVHTVGAVSDPAGGLVRRVHTVDRIPLRAGRLSPSSWWVLRERRRRSTTAAWLTHGRTAGRLLVDAGVAPGDRVHCLPLLPPVESMPLPYAGVWRSAVRSQLGVAPGVRLVVGVEPRERPWKACDWGGALLCQARRDLVVAQIQSEDPVSSDRFFVKIGNERLPETLSISQLLAAADVFVAAGCGLDAYSAAAGALADGIPVIAATTDAAAELVVAGRTGFVVPPRARSVARAVLAQLDTGLPRRPGAVPRVDEAHRVADLAHALLMVYRQVLGAPAVGRAA